MENQLTSNLNLVAGELALLRDRISRLSSPRALFTAESLAHAFDASHRAERFGRRPLTLDVDVVLAQLDASPVRQLTVLPPHLFFPHRDFDAPEANLLYPFYGRAAAAIATAPTAFFVIGLAKHGGLRVRTALTPRQLARDRAVYCRDLAMVFASLSPDDPRRETARRLCAAFQVDRQFPSFAA